MSKIRDFFRGLTPMHSVISKYVVNEVISSDSRDGNLAMLVDEMMDYLWIESQEHVLKPVEIDLTEKIRIHLKYFSGVAGGMNLRLEFNPPDEEVRVFADSSSLGKMLGMLMINAIKYAETYVRIELSEEGNQVLLHVCNDGKMNLPGNKKGVFKPFLQYHSLGGNDAEGYTGVGLSLIQYFARKNSCKFLIEKPGEKGMCFLLSLPKFDESDLRIELSRHGVIGGYQSRDGVFLENFKKAVMENLDSDLSNEVLAAKLGTSQSTLIRKIKKLLDTTPANYVGDCRLVTAATCLKNNPDISVTEVCYAVGFTSVSYFAKCFKARYGVTPREYANSK